MISGAHIIIYSKDLRRIAPSSAMCLNFLPWTRSRWLIFALPLRSCVSSSEKNDLHELYFMCDDLLATMKSLKGKKVGAVQCMRSAGAV